MFFKLKIKKFSQRTERFKICWTNCTTKCGAVHLHEPSTSVEQIVQRSVVQYIYTNLRHLLNKLYNEVWCSTSTRTFDICWTNCTTKCDAVHLHEPSTSVEQIVQRSVVQYIYTNLRHLLNKLYNEVWCSTSTRTFDICWTNYTTKCGAVHLHEPSTSVEQIVQRGVVQYIYTNLRHLLNKQIVQRSVVQYIYTNLRHLLNKSVEQIVQRSVVQYIYTNLRHLLNKLYNCTTKCGAVHLHEPSTSVQQIYNEVWCSTSTRTFDICWTNCTTRCGAVHLHEPSTSVEQIVQRSVVQYIYTNLRHLLNKLYNEVWCSTSTRTFDIGWTNCTTKCGAVHLHEPSTSVEQIVQRSVVQYIYTNLRHCWTNCTTKWGAVHLHEPSTSVEQIVQRSVVQYIYTNLRHLLNKLYNECGAVHLHEPSTSVEQTVQRSVVQYIYTNLHEPSTSVEQIIQRSVVQYIYTNLRHLLNKLYNEVWCSTSTRTFDICWTNCTTKCGAVHLHESPTSVEQIVQRSVVQYIYTNLRHRLNKLYNEVWCSTSTRTFDICWTNCTTKCGAVHLHEPSTSVEQIVQRSEVQYIYTNLRHLLNKLYNEVWCSTSTRIFDICWTNCTTKCGAVHLHEPSTSVEQTVQRSVVQYIYTNLRHLLNKLYNEVWCSTSTRTFDICWTNCTTKCGAVHLHEPSTSVEQIVQRSVVQYIYTNLRHLLNKLYNEVWCSTSTRTFGICWTNCTTKCGAVHLHEPSTSVEQTVQRSVVQYIYTNLRHLLNKLYNEVWCSTSTRTFDICWTNCTTKCGAVHLHEPSTSVEQIVQRSVVQYIYTNLRHLLNKLYNEVWCSTSTRTFDICWTNCTTKCGAIHLHEPSTPVEQIVQRSVVQYIYTNLRHLLNKLYNEVWCSTSTRTFDICWTNCTTKCGEVHLHEPSTSVEQIVQRCVVQYIYTNLRHLLNKLYNEVWCMASACTFEGNHSKQIIWNLATT